MLHLILILVIPIAYTVSFDDNCKSPCYGKGEKGEAGQQRCHADAKADNAKEIQGTYQLNEGFFNLSCSMLSLPEPMVITWVYLPEGATTTMPVACANAKTTYNCRINENKQQLTESLCAVRTDKLIKSGKYRCEALYEYKEETNHIQSTEAIISVVGIERVDVVSSVLQFGEPGHVEVEFCANPKPEVVWLTRGAVMQPGHTSHRMTALKLLEHKERKEEARQGPAHIVPYCYRTRLIIGKVEAEDANVSIVIRNEGETRTKPINLQIEGLPKGASTDFSRLKILLVLAASLLCFATKRELLY